jgi:hypothetical protein
MTNPKLILVTGATGYVGGRLVPKLLEAGYRVRCLVRDPARLQGRPWQKQVEVVSGDALDLSTLVNAMQGVSIAYYLIHGMQGGKINAERDLSAAQNFSALHAVDQIVRNRYAVHGLDKFCGRERVALDDFHFMQPGTSLQTRRVTHETAHAVACFQKFRHEPPADVSRCTSDEDQF